MRLQRSSQLTWYSPGKAVAEPISDSRVSQIIINCKCPSCPLYSWTKRVHLCIVGIPVQTSTDDLFSQANVQIHPNVYLSVNSKAKKPWLTFPVITYTRPLYYVRATAQHPHVQSGRYQMYVTNVKNGQSGIYRWGKSATCEVNETTNLCLALEKIAF